MVLGDKQRHFGSLIYVKGPPPKFAIHLERQVINRHRREQDHWYIFDGRYLVERINDRKQFIRRELMSAEQARDRNPLAIGDSPFVVPLPLRRKHLMDQFVVQIEDPAEDDPPNSIHFKLKPKPQRNLKIKRIDLWHDRTTLLPIKAHTLDESQYESIVWLEQPVLNEPIGEAMIDTTAPKEPGWQIEDIPLKS